MCSNLFLSCGQRWTSLEWAWNELVFFCISHRITDVLIANMRTMKRRLCVFFLNIILVGCYRDFTKIREFIEAFVLIIVIDYGLLDSYPGTHISLKMNTSTLRDPIFCFPLHTVSQMKQIWNASSYICLCTHTYTHNTHHTKSYCFAELQHLDSPRRDQNLLN